MKEVKFNFIIGPTLEMTLVLGFSFAKQDEKPI